MHAHAHIRPKYGVPANLTQNECPDLASNPKYPSSTFRSSPKEAFLVVCMAPFASRSCPLELATPKRVANLQVTLARVVPVK